MAAINKRTNTEHSNTKHNTQTHSPQSASRHSPLGMRQSQSTDKETPLVHWNFCLSWSWSSRTLRALVTADDRVAVLTDRKFVNINKTLSRHLSWNLYVKKFQISDKLFICSLRTEACPIHFVPRSATFEKHSVIWLCGRSEHALVKTSAVFLCRGPTANADCRISIFITYDMHLLVYDSLSLWCQVYGIW